MPPAFLLFLFASCPALAADDDPFAAMKDLYARIETEVSPRLDDNDALGAVEASRRFVEEEKDVQALQFLLDLRSSYLAAAGEEAQARLSMARAQNLAGRLQPPREYEEAAWEAARAQVRWEEPEAVLKEAAKTHSVIMISEAHHVPETRAFGRAVLPLLRGLGFEFLAMEALKHPVPENPAKVTRSTAPDAASGYYLMEPQMAGLVREALRLGFKLAAYEDETTGGGDREEIQAQNLYERVLKAQPDAKVVVWAGYGHVYKRSPFDRRMMAQRLWELTGREPFSLFQVADALDPFLSDQAFYKPLVLDDPARPERALVLRNRPGLFPALDALPGSGLDRDGQGAPSVDGYVVHPRFRMGGLRPAWLSRAGRMRLSGELRGKREGPLLVQAFPAREGVRSSPADQMVCRSGTAYELWLEPGEHILRVRDAGGRILFEAPHAFAGPAPFVVDLP